MTILPSHPASRRAAVLWLMVCAASLVVMLARLALHAVDRTALTSLVPMYWMSLPLGHAGVMAGIDIRTALYLAGTPTSILAEGLFLWLVLGVIGYGQWFLLLPLVVRKCQQLLHFVFNRDTAGKRPVS